jgi:hypothetical protein
MNGSDAWPLLTWNPVTLPIAWQGISGQEGSGTLEVLPSTIVVRELVAAPAPATRATRMARAPTAAAASPRLTAGRVATASPDILDIPLLLS